MHIYNTILHYFFLFSEIKLFFSCNIKPLFNIEVKKKSKWSKGGGGERSGSVVECLTRDRRAAFSSLTGVTGLWSLSKTHLS